MREVEIIALEDYPSLFSREEAFVVHFKVGLTEHSSVRPGKKEDFEKERFVDDLSGSNSWSVDNASDWILKNHNLLRAIDKCHETLLAQGLISFDPAFDDIGFDGLEFDATSKVRKTFLRDFIEDSAKKYPVGWNAFLVAQYAIKNYEFMSLEYIAALASFHILVNPQSYLSGYLATEVLWKTQHETDALTGKKQIRSQKKRTDKSGNQSALARKIRIKLMMAKCGWLRRNNPDLKTDDDYDVAKRAIGIVAREHPEFFPKGRGKQQYQQYWEDGKADKYMWKTYLAELNKT